MGAQQATYDPEEFTLDTMAPAAKPGVTTEQAELADVRTIVVKIRPTALRAIGGQFRLIVRGPKAGLATLSKSYVGYAATAAADAWQFTDPVAFTWNGGDAALTDFDDQEYTSDTIAFPSDGSVALCFAFEIPTASRVPLTLSLGDDYVSFYKDGVSESASESKGSGYTSLPGFSFFIERIEAAP